MRRSEADEVERGAWSGERQIVRQCHGRSSSRSSRNRLSRPAQLALYVALILGSLIMLAPFFIMLVVVAVAE